MGSRALCEAEFLFQIDEVEGDDCVENTNDDDDDNGELAGGEPLSDAEVWADYWSEELVTLWHFVQDKCTANGYAILEKCTFPLFVDFCWEHSSRYPPPQTPHNG